MNYSIFQDLKYNKGNTKGKIIAIFFRLGNLSTKSKFWKVVLFPYVIFYKIFFEWIIGFEVPYDTSIGSGLQVFHLQSIVINKDSVIGTNCIIRHCTTIGNKDLGSKCPKIGNNVNMGSNVCIIGPIEIGDHVKIGAGSVVTKSIPPNCTVAGNPAKIIHCIQNEDSNNLTTLRP